MYYPRNSVVVKHVFNGFIVETKGTREEQEDNLDGVHVFEKATDMSDFLVKFFNEVEKKA